MTGKKFFNRAFLLLFLVLLIPGILFGGKDDEWIAVLLSDSAAAYEVPLRSFTDSIGMDVRVFNLHGDIRHDPELESKFFAQKPAFIFALGAKAAFVAKLWTQDRQDIPVLFARVLNWRKYNLLDGQDNMAGISCDVNPGNQFINLSMLAPQIRKIGVIYSPKNSGEIVAQGRTAVKALGLELVERPVDSGKAFKLAYRELYLAVDGLWILNDPATYTLHNMDWLEKRCIADQLVCIGQSKNLAESGLMLSVQPDIYNIGAQAASMAKNILKRGQLPADIGVMEPLGTNIYVNRSTAERIGLDLNEQILSLATKIIE
ncbi:MAG: hypothetical protein KQH63_02200 [Desulfobulbaceae bacterium]|nr:hypothetical protein [Desulfobulbaceae bacterium]